MLQKNCCKIIFLVQNHKIIFTDKCPKFWQVVEVRACAMCMPQLLEKEFNRNNLRNFSNGELWIESGGGCLNPRYVLAKVISDKEKKERVLRRRKREIFLGETEKALYERKRDNCIEEERVSKKKLSIKKAIRKKEKSCQKKEKIKEKRRSKVKKKARK